MSAKHSPHVVVAHMRGAVVLNNPIHLDGLLLAAREKRDGIAARNTPFPHLAWRDGVFQASVGLLVHEGIGGIMHGSVVRTKRIDMKRDGAKIAFAADSKKSDRTIDAMSPYRSRMQTEPVLGNVKQVVWQALGDMDEVTDLMSYVTSVGKMYATGWGEVERFEVLPCEADPATCGLVAGGMAVRNLPVSILDALGVASDIVFEGRLEPPYGQQEGMVRITAPSLSDTQVSEAKARELFAY